MPVGGGGFGGRPPPQGIETIRTVGRRPSNPNPLPRGSFLTPGSLFGGMNVGGVPLSQMMGAGTFVPPALTQSQQLQNILRMLDEQRRKQKPQATPIPPAREGERGAIPIPSQNVPEVGRDFPPMPMPNIESPLQDFGGSGRLSPIQHLFDLFRRIL